MKRCITQILGLIMAVFMLLPALPGFAEDTVIEEPISEAAVEVILSPDADESVELVPEISLFDDETLMPEETLEASVPEAEEASATKAAVENQPIAANSIPSKLTLGVKETYKIDTSGLKGKMTYKSSETKIVTVSKKGVIKAKKAGNAKITVCAGNTVLAAIELTVKAAPNKVALSKTKLAMNKGETYALQASLPKNTASKITWTSSDKKVASVTADGVVTARKAGTAKITAKTFNGKRSVCTVNVAKNVFPFTVKSGVITAYNGVGGTVIIPAVDARGKPVTAIGDGAFRGNGDITSVEIEGEYLSKIGNSAFEGCGSLTQARLSGSVLSIGKRAFANCPKLAHVEIPSGISHIASNAFANHGDLTISGWKNSDAQAFAKKKGIPFLADYPAAESLYRTTVFGALDQDNNTRNGKEPVLWYILESDGSTATLISVDALDGGCFHEDPWDYDNNVWEKCTLRAWLNGAFIDAAFTPQEQEALQTVTVPAESNPQYPGRSPGNATKDRVWLLSISETLKYFKTDESRRAMVTATAMRHGAWDKEGYGFWWLRVPGRYSDSIVKVDFDGEIDYQGTTTSNYMGSIRPVIRIKY